DHHTATTMLHYAVLSCDFRTEKDQNPRIEWKKKEKAVTFVYFNHKFTSRAKMEGATLTIHSVTQKDSGEYRCEVTAGDDHVSFGEATVTLDVHVPPHIPSCEVPHSVFVGSDLELLCKDKQSVPPATYSWYKDNRALKVSSNTPYSMDTRRGTLQKFTSVSKVDSGMYRCESSNSVGAPKSCVAQQLKVIDCKLSFPTRALTLLCFTCVLTRDFFFFFFFFVGGTDPQVTMSLNMWRNPKSPKGRAINTSLLQSHCK
uniref:Junctional adhesion molecule 2b n=1 Tax=Hippocampus comes TaxID=109280 RepID=A0A3Q3DRZ2_HIPCM